MVNISPHFRKWACFFSLAAALAATLCARAQEPKTDAEGHGWKGRIHFVKLIWYKPLPGGSKAPDTSVVPELVQGNTLTEYDESGMLKTQTRYLPGRADGMGDVSHWTYVSNRLVKLEHKDPLGKLTSLTKYTNDTAGREVRREEMQRLAYENFEDFRYEVVTTRWESTRKIVYTQECYDCMELPQEPPSGLGGRHYIYDTAGRLLDEMEYTKGAVIRRAVHTHDSNVRLVQTVSRGADTNFYHLTKYGYDSAGRITRYTSAVYYKGEKTMESLVASRYNARGDLAYHELVKNGHSRTVTTLDYRYDAKGNCVRKTWSKNGRPEAVAVYKLTYYEP